MSFIYTHQTLRTLVTPAGVVTPDPAFATLQQAPVDDLMIDFTGELGSSRQAVIGIVWVSYDTDGVAVSAGGTLSMTPVDTAPAADDGSIVVSAGAAEADIPQGTEVQIQVGYKSKLTMQVDAGSLDATAESVKIFWRRLS